MKVAAYFLCHVLQLSLPYYPDISIRLIFLVNAMKLSVIFALVWYRPSAAIGTNVNYCAFPMFFV